MSDVSSLEIRVLSDGIRVAEARLTALERAARRAEGQTDRNARSATRMGNAFSTAGRVAAGALAIVGVGAIGVAASLGTATAAWLKYDKAIKEVRSISAQTTGEFRELRKEVLLLASSIGVDATDAAKGLYQIISAGIPKGDSLEFLSVASRSSIAGVSTVEASVDALTAVINAYGMAASDAEKVSDKLFLVVRDGITTFPELAGSLSQATGPAEALGVSLDELLSQVIAITNKKVPTAQAFTEIKATIQALNDPSDQMIEALKAMGFESSRAAVATLGYGEVLNRVRKYYDGNDAALVKAFRSSEAYNGVLATTGRNSDKAADALNNLKGASGNMAKAFAVNSDTLGTAIESVKTSAILLVEQMESSMGIITAFGEALRGVAGMIAEVNSLSGGIFGSGANVSNALNLSGEFGAATKLKQIRELTAAQDALVKSGADASKAGSFADYVTAGGANNARLKQITIEIDALNKSFSTLSKTDQDMGYIQSEVNDLVKAQREATDPADVEEYSLRLKNLREDYAGIKAEVSATAVAEVAATEQKKKLAEEEQALHKKQQEEAKKVLELEKDKEEQEKKTLKTAKDLATTQKEKLTAEKEGIQALVDAGKLDGETGQKAIANLTEQIKLLDERNAKAGGGGGKGGKGGGASALRLADIESQLPEIADVSYNENPFDRLAKEEKDLEDSYNRRRKMILEQTSITESEKLALLTSTESRYTKMQRELELERQRIMVSGVGDLFGNLSQIASVFGKKGAKAAKALAIVQATVKMYESATSAYASAAAIPYYGYIAAPIAAGAALAAGAANIAAIKSQDESGGIGMYDKGGLIPSGSVGIVGELGPELVRGPAMVSSRRATADATSGDGGSGANVSVSIINNTGASVTEKRSKDGDTEMVQFIIGQAAERVANDIKKGGTGIAKALEGTYNFTRGRKV